MNTKVNDLMHIIKNGINNIIKQEKTGTFNKILKHPKINIDINEELIELIVKTKDYRMIKKTYNHNNFDKNKYSLSPNFSDRRLFGTTPNY